MSGLFHKILVEPLFYLLVWLYNNLAFQDLGVAIILLTLVVRIVLFPLFYKSFKSQAALQKLRPELEKIQNQHKDNREKQAQAMLELYRRHQINPLTTFLLLLIQLPILIALYRVFLQPPPDLNSWSLGLIDLKETSIMVVVLSVVAQYFQGRLSLPKQKADPMAKNMVFIGPVLTLTILAYLPSAVGFYWLTTTLFSIGQQLYINKIVYGYGTDSRSNSKDVGTGRFS